MTAATAPGLDDAGPLLPPAAARWLATRRGRWTRADSAAAVLSVVGLVPVVAVAWGGGLYADDIRGLALFGPEPFVETLFWSGGSHVVPGTHAVLWLHARLAGLSYTPVLVLVPALRLLATWAVWRMLRAVRGPDRWAVVALAVYVALPLGVSAMAWYVQALTVLPVHLATAWSVTWLVRWHQDRRLRHAVGVAAAVAFGLCFAEKTAALFVLLPVLCLIGLGTAGGVTGPLRALRRDAAVLAGLAVVAGGWLATYLGSGGDTGKPVSAVDTVELLGRGAWSGVLPTLVGGPWTWRPGGLLYESAPFYSVAAPPAGASVSGLGLVVVAVVAAWRIRRRRAVEAVLVVLAFYVPCGVLVAMARWQQLGGQLAVDLRFWADLVPVLALAVALAGRRSGQDDLPPARWRGFRRRAATLVAVAATGSVAVSVVGFSEPWHRNPSARYLDQLSAELEAPREANVFDVEVAEDVLSPIFRPRTGVSFVAGPLEAGTEIGLTDATMLVPAHDGTLVAAEWVARATSARGPVPRCGWQLSRASGRTAVVELPRRVPHESNLSVRLDLLAGQPVRVVVRAYDGRRWLTVRRPTGLDDGRSLTAPVGLSGLVARLPQGAVERLEVTSLGQGVTCVLQAELGVPVAAR